MPTGSGKTTLVSSFKPDDTCSLVFAPFKVLVKQLGTVLAQKGKVVSYPFVSNDGDMYTILATADFIIMPYEAAPTSADMVCCLSRIGRLGPIWIDEVHNLTTACRFRLSLDSFWNLQAELQTRGLSPKMIGLSATLRPDDVPDVMRRLSISNVDVYRRSCHRAELGFKFEKPFQHEKTMFDKATELAVERSKEGKVMLFTSTVSLCEVMMDQIVSRFQG
jgi:superfamily II DNA helicase RecQ